MTEIKKSRSELKRAAIIDGAMQAFQQYGVNDTSMDKIAETAGVSKRTVYNHFASKEILVTHIITEIWRSNKVKCDIPFDPNAPIRPQLLTLVHHELAMLEDDNIFELIRVAIGYCLFSPIEFVEEMNAQFAEETALLRWLKAAQQHEALKIEDAEKTNCELISLIKGQAFWPQVLRQSPLLSKAELDTLANKTVDIFLAYYRK